MTEIKFYRAQHSLVINRKEKGEKVKGNMIEV